MRSQNCDVYITFTLHDQYKSKGECKFKDDHNSNQWMQFQGWIHVQEMIKVQRRSWVQGSDKFSVESTVSGADSSVFTPILGIAPSNVVIHNFKSSLQNRETPCQH